MDALPTESIRSNTSCLIKVCGGSGVEDLKTTKRCGSAHSAVNRNYDHKISAVEGNDAPDEAGAVFRQREGGVDATAETSALWSAGASEK